MPSLKRVKREMLRQVVAENRHLLERGALAPPPSPRRRGVPLSGRIVLGGVLGVVALIAANTLSTDQPARLAVAPEAVAPATSMSAPQAVDPALFALAVRRIMLDPGHGGSDPGALAPGGATEKELNLDIALRLRDKLLAAQFEVPMTREEDVFLSLKERAAAANARQADLFVSIHVNSIPKPQRRGVETYFLGSSDDPSVHALVAAENTGSGYSLADYRSLLDRVYSGVRRTQSEELARTVQADLFRGLRRRNPALENRGVKSAPFVVLLTTEMPGVLVEVSCISNREEARLLAQGEYRDGIAQALFDGISSYAAGRGPAAPRQGA